MDLTCATCGIDIWRRTSDYNRKIRLGQTKFYCDAHRNAKSPRVNRRCPCGTIFKVRKFSIRKFCSRTCSVTSNNRLRKRKEHRKVYRACLSCQILFSCKASSTKKYCNAQCQQDHYWHETCIEIRSTGAFASHKEAKRYMLHLHGHKCMVCGKRKWLGEPIPLVLDHIDGNSENYATSNFRLLCCNCDAQTDTYKGRNKGNGRHSRRERYRLGLSY